MFVQEVRVGGQENKLKACQIKTLQLYGHGSHAVLEICENWNDGEAQQCLCFL